MELEGVALGIPVGVTLLQSVATKRALTRVRPHEGVTLVALEGVALGIPKGDALPCKEPSRG